jgi:hypothetical protein
MSIVASDIVFRFTTKSGSAGDTTAGTPAGSLGKYAANNALTNATLANLFDNVSDTESAAGDTSYRSFWVLNNHATLTLTNARVVINTDAAGGAAVDIATDNIGITAKGSASAQGAQIANELTAPTGISAWGDGPLTIGDIPPGSGAMVWVRRIITAGQTAVPLDSVTIDVIGGTL